MYFILVSGLACVWGRPEVKERNFIDSDPNTGLLTLPLADRLWEEAPAEDLSR